MKATTLFPLFIAIVLFSACRETSVKKNDRIKDFNKLTKYRENRP